MTNYRFKVGDAVIVSDGSRPEVGGCVVGILPDTKGLGHDMIKVRLNSGDHQVISVTVPLSQVRFASGS